VLLSEADPEGGLDLDAAAKLAAGPMLGRLHAAGLHTGIRAETHLDPAAQPFLDHHRIDDIPVLPGVMGIEAFWELAGTVAGSRRPQRIEDVNFLAPFKFYRNEPRDLELQAALEWAPADQAVARCALVGRRTLAGREDAQETRHFTASVWLGANDPEDLGTWDGAAPGERPDSAVSAADLYAIYFHGPAFQVLEAAWQQGDNVVGKLSETLPRCCERDDALVASPRLVELCLQTAGVWEIGRSGRMGLPQHIERLWLAPPDGAAEGPCHAIVTPREDGAFDAQVVDVDGRVRVRMEGYRTAALPVELDASLCAPLRAAMSE